MFMPVMNIRHMRVAVRYGFVGVVMAVRLRAFTAIMAMVMVRIVVVAVRVD